MSEANARRLLKRVPGLYVVRHEDKVSSGHADCSYVVKHDGRSGFIELKYGAWPHDVLGYGLTPTQAAFLVAWAMHGGRSRVLHVYGRGQCVMFDRDFPTLVTCALRVRPCYVGHVAPAMLPFL